MSTLNHDAVFVGVKLGIEEPLSVVGTSDVPFTNTSTIETNPLILPNNYLKVGSKYEFRLSGSVLKSGRNNSNLIINLKIGNTSIPLTLALGTGAIGGVGRGFEVRGSFTTRSIGTSGTIYSEFASVVSTLVSVTSNITNTTTINTTIDNNITFRVNGSNSGTSGTIRSYHIKESI
jgi:hypothetical protein